MPIDPYKNIRLLTIKEVAELWHRDRTVRVALARIEAELRRGLVNMAPGRNWRADGSVPIEQIYDLDALPPAETEVTKDWVEEFAIKQGWSLPRFWFPEQAPPVRNRGRPSDMPLILEEMCARAARSELADTVTEEARQLRAWALGQGIKGLKVESIRKKISAEYNIRKDQLSLPYDP